MTIVSIVQLLLADNYIENRVQLAAQTFNSLQSHQFLYANYGFNCLFCQATVNHITHPHTPDGSFCMLNSQG